MFILNNVVIIKIVLNFACMTMGSSRLLLFLRDSQAYEKSASFVPLEDRGRRLRFRLRKIASLVVLVIVYGMAIRIYVDSAMQDSREQWRIPVLVCSFFTLLVFLFYDSLAYVILSSCSAVLAEYLRVELVALGRCRTPRRVEEVRLRLSIIKKLRRSLNEIWHPALAVWSACLILVLCITLYTIFDGDIGQPEVLVALAYSAYASMSFADLAILSQCLSDLRKGTDQRIAGPVRPHASSANSHIARACFRRQSEFVEGPPGLYALASLEEGTAVGTNGIFALEPADSHVSHVGITQPIVRTLNCAGVPVDMQVDAGSPVSVFTWPTYEQNKTVWPKLRGSPLKLTFVLGRLPVALDNAVAPPGLLAQQSPVDRPDLAVAAGRASLGKNFGRTTSSDGAGMVNAVGPEGENIRRHIDQIKPRVGEDDLDDGACDPERQEATASPQVIGTPGQGPEISDAATSPPTPVPRLSGRTRKPPDLYAP
ncbi:hypothetical protein HPB49_010401 [Dermacentor silvarum]|uniref:Uncharacterized protein n=1 Tax=Dermacentor silvarum TaxID=543639 RepID=A0ACB8C3C1_DERSI|nr:hypothetical protein HPB49_010401 [Dermacentor silvarum]